MTDQEINVAIAESCGWTIWKHLPTPETGEMMPVMIPPKHLRNKGESTRFADDLPNYINDLNAMHDALGVLNADQRDTFRDHLSSICFRECVTENIASPFAEFAQAKDFAEAFLKTLNLWKQ